MLTIEDILANEVLDRAYAWLCHWRRAFPDASDTCSFRRNWSPQPAKRWTSGRRATRWS
jgi:hypothetical protein